MPVKYVYEAKNDNNKLFSEAVRCRIHRVFTECGEDTRDLCYIMKLVILKIN